MDDAVEALKRRWEAVDGRRDALEAEAAARVRRWVWTTMNGVRWRFQPFYGERTGESPGRILKAPPERLQEVDAYGYDAEGGLALARLYRSPAGVYNVVAVEHDGPRSWASFFTDRRLNRVSLLERDDAGRPMAVTEYQASWGDVGWWNERYVWHEGRLAEIHKRYDEENAPAQERARWAAGERELLEYDEDGALTTVRLESPGQEPMVIYRRPAPGGSAAALRALERALPDAVQLALARVPDLRPFALALQYDTEFPVPPTLIAVARDDCLALRRRDADPRYWLNPAEWSGPELPLALEPFGVEPAVLAATIGREEAQDEARSTLNRAARRLNRSPPESLADDPPVVFAVDVHLEHLEENVRAAVPAARRRELGIP